MRRLISKSKLFSGAATPSIGAGAEQPGQLRGRGVPRHAARHQPGNAWRKPGGTGLGLDAHINLVSRFDRKNYFYADLPAGYQISQFAHPVVGRRHGRDRAGGRQPPSAIGVTRLHLEQDAGKFPARPASDEKLHRPEPLGRGADGDRQRAGPAQRPRRPAPICASCARSPRYLGTCDGNMEEGSMRADVNVSACATHGEPFRTRCEVKNVNSVRFVMQAIEAEAARQVAVWEDGRRRSGQGNAAVRPRPRRDAQPAQQGGRPRLPLLPRPGPAAAGARRGLGGRP